MTVPPQSPMGPPWLAPLQAALEGYSQRATTAANRMADVQELVIQELKVRFASLGELAEIRAERPVRGKHRTKSWDVTFAYARRVQLAISTKAIIGNISGSVPNRIDDAMGECVNVHAYDPAIVLGYLFIMEHQGGQRPNRSAGTTWFDFFANALTSFSGRRSPADEPELFEAAMLMSVEFTRTPVGVQFHPRLLDWPQFFEVLVGHVRARNPLIDLVMRQPGVS